MSTTTKLPILVPRNRKALTPPTVPIAPTVSIPMPAPISTPVSAPVSVPVSTPEPAPKQMPKQTPKQTAETDNWGKRGNPNIWSILKGFRRCRWTGSDGVTHTGNIMLRGPAHQRVTIEADDATEGQRWRIPYSMIYDKEPGPRLVATPTDMKKDALSTATHVQFPDKTGRMIVGTVLRRNPKSVSVLPVGETDPKKYYLVPYLILTPVPAPTSITSSSAPPSSSTPSSSSSFSPSDEFTVMVSSDGDRDDHYEACDHASYVTKMHLGHEGNGSRGGYFTHGVTVTYKEILTNPILAKIFKIPHKEMNLYPASRGVECIVSIFKKENYDDDD